MMLWSNVVDKTIQFVVLQTERERRARRRDFEVQADQSVDSSPLEEQCNWSDYVVGDADADNSPKSGVELFQLQKR
jgi:hypothetical protein